MRAAARTTRTDAALAARARAFDAGVFERGAEEVVRVDGATILRSPSLPAVPHLNAVVVQGPLDAAAVEALVDQHHGGLAEQRVVAQDEAAGERLLEELPARGWSARGLLILARDGAKPPPETAALAEEVPYGHVRGLRREWLSAQDWARRGDALQNALAADDRLLASTPTRAFAVFEHGRPLAYALLIDGGRDGMLEDVYATPEARGRGLASAACAAVLHAARAERHEHVFVPTDADTGAGGLYERLGFAPLTLQRIFTRRVA